MTSAQEKRGGAAVGFITELEDIEAASVMYLRLWCDGPDSQAHVWHDFASRLGPDRGRKALKSFEDLCSLCTRHGRRPLMRHAVNCKCLGSDESCFANFIGTAVMGDRDDAMLIATLLVRPDVAPLLTSLATEFGLALKQMCLVRPPRMGGKQEHFQAQPATLH